MAVTITYQPMYMAPSYSDHTYEMYDEARKDNADLYYELDIVVGSVTRTLKQLPDINKKARINIAKILQGFIESKLFIHEYTTMFATVTDGMLPYYCVARSWSGGSSTEERSANHWVFNGTLQQNVSWDVTRYWWSNGLPAYWLNEWQGIKRIHADDDIFLQTVVGDYEIIEGGEVFQPLFAGISVELVYKNGTNFIWNFDYTQPATASVLSINVGLRALKYFYPSLPTENVDYYEVVDYYNLNARRMRIYVTDVDTRYDRYFRIAYLGQLGTTEMFNFDLDNRNILSVEKTEFLNSNLRKVYNPNVTDSYRVTSDFITEDEAADLKYLWTSPVAAVYDYNNFELLNETPIVIQDSGVDVLKRRNQKLINYVMNFKYAYEYINYRQ